MTAEEFDAVSQAVYAEINEVAARAQAAPLPSKEFDLESVFAPLEVTHG